LVLAQPLTTTFGSTAFLRIADLAVAQTTFRVQNNAGLQVGSVVHLEQGGAKGDHVVDNVAGDFVILASGGLTAAYKLDSASADVPVTSYEFTLVFTKPGLPAETFANLSMDNRHSRYYGAAVTSSLVNVLPAPVPSVQPPPNNMPKVAAATNLAGGGNDDPGAIGLNNYNAALAALEKVDGVNMVCAPDAAGKVDILAAVLAHCEQRMRDRFAILDAGTTANLPDPGTSRAVALRQRLDSPAGFAALYFPWIVINDPLSRTGNDTLLVPPSGHIAGIYARSDTQRGVHKAPANEFITGAIDLERALNDTDQGEINDVGINALRVFPGSARPIVWGARTTAPPDQVAWRYVNVRRLFLFVEKSLQVGIRWAVFEPNDRSLWKKLERTIGEFLTRVWRSGALFGKTAAEAFYVKIDDELNPEPIRALGQIIIEIGIAPVRPAEFVIVRIAMWDGGASVTEG
jgi:phage tail sheath protein FI